MINAGARTTIDVAGGAEDRNRTAPFPHCGNRFEFRAVGSSQNCSMPIAVCNTLFADGMAHLSGLIEGGMSLRDAVAQMYKENREIIFTGNGYSDEWPVEAAKRGLPNLKTAPEAGARVQLGEDQEGLRGDGHLLARGGGRPAGAHVR